MKKSGKKLNSLILMLGLIVLLGYFLITLVQLQIDIKQKENVVTSLSEQYEQQQLDNAEVKRLIEAENEAELIERIARESRGYVYPDEKVYFDVTPGD